MSNLKVVEEAGAASAPPADQLAQVVAQDGAVPRGDGAVLQVGGLAQRGQHGARVGTHEAVVVEAEVGREWF